MFVITLANMFVTTTGLAVRHEAYRTWPTLEEAIEAATELNAQYGLHAYIHPADRTDRCVEAVLIHSFGYAN